MRVRVCMWSTVLKHIRTKLQHVFSGRRHCLTRQIGGMESLLALLSLSVVDAGTPRIEVCCGMLHLSWKASLRQRAWRVQPLMLRSGLINGGDRWMCRYGRIPHYSNHKSARFFDCEWRGYGKLRACGRFESNGTMSIICSLLADVTIVLPSPKRIYRS